MTDTKATLRPDSQVARLLEQCEHADFFRFEVPGAPSITIHVEPDGMGRWAVTRYGWQDVMAWTGDGWQRFTGLPDDQRFIWPIAAVLDAVPGLLAALDAEHAAWKLRRLQAERAAALAGVVEETIEPYRAYRETAEATGQAVSA